MSVGGDSKMRIERINEIAVNELGNEIISRLFIIQKTQKWLADECGVSKVYISQIVRGIRPPSVKITEKLAPIMKIEAEELRRLALIPLGQKKSEQWRM